MNGYWDGSLYNNAHGQSTDPAYHAALLALWGRLTPGSTFCGANFGATTYTWNLIQDDHTDPVDAGDVEVAELCYQIGVAIDSDYGVLGTGSDWWRVGAPIRDYFRYDGDAIYSNPIDVDMMTEEIQWLRPLCMGGSNAGGGGHGWVIFGYNKATDPNRQFKMNLGWGGGVDGWYTLDAVPGGLNFTHNHLTHIAPAGVVRFVGNTTSGDGSPADPYRNVTDAVTLAPSGTTLIFEAGSDNTFSGSYLELNRPFVLKGKNATIRKL
jgi:hypothetical protein